MAELTNIPDLELSSSNPFAHGEIVVFDDSNDQLLLAKPLVIVPSPDDRYYTVEQGDTLTSISNLAYQDSRYWRFIADANNIINPFELVIGQSILIPDFITTKVANNL